MLQPTIYMPSRLTKLLEASRGTGCTRTCHRLRRVHPQRDGNDPPRQLRLHLQPQLAGRGRGELEIRRLAGAGEKPGGSLATLDRRQIGAG